MSDTHIENAILLAIDIIADKKVSQANFDKTIKAVVKERKDKTTGEYLIKYQDSEFTAYATSSDIFYENGTLVYVLIPGNDWDRIKTIIGNTKQQATVYKEVPESELLYNRIGPNAISGQHKFELCSYHQPIPNEQESYILLLNMALEQLQKIKNYIRQGDGLAIGMSVRTAFDSGQIGGWYGLIFNLKFIDAEGHAATRPYIVSSKDVIGNPYALTRLTFIECLIKDINTEQFDGILNIIAFVDGFPNTDLTINKPDIFINGIYMYGAQILTLELLNGYSVNIDYSNTGNILENPNEEIKLVAQLKVKGKVITENVDYYWCRENGLVFRGNPQYFGRAGDGWECLNNYFNTTLVPYKTGEFSLYHQGAMPPLTLAAAEIRDRVNNIRCVAVYDNNTFIGDCRIIDMNSLLVSIDSSDKIGTENKTIYYLDNGSPTLTCVFEKERNKNYKYTWSVYPLHGKGYQIEQQEGLLNLYKIKKRLLDILIKEINKVEKSKQDDFKREHEYLNKINYLNSLVLDIKNQNQGYYRAFEDILYDFPIKSITGSSRIVCVVEEHNLRINENLEEELYWTYIGTGSITLENRKELEGQYSLTLENGIQVFQYDNKGNSPLSSHLDKALLILPLGFTLIDNEGTIIPYEQIINNGYVKWLVPKENSLLICNEEENPFITGLDNYFASLGFKIYNNIQTLKYTIADQYDRNKDFNYIRLNIKYKDMIFDAYTEFTFPKDGDPGTNGTDFMAKIVPVNEQGKELNSDRLYVSNQLNGQMFDDQGRKIDRLKAKLYNNSRLVENETPYLWTCPPKGVNKDQNRGNTYLNVNFNTQKVLGKTSLNLDVNNWEQILKERDLPIDIIRAMYSIKDLKCYAEIPVCYSYIFNIDNYRLKVVPKTGFKYVVYSSDGTSPNYDNTKPFEIIVLKYEDGYFIDRTEEGYTFKWSVIGNLENPVEDSLKTCSIKPKDIFNGSDLFSAIVCEVKLNDITHIGFIHIPIYMILNRYGHQALNNWDGNSILLNANGDTILAPQVGAGKKDPNNNTFTGVLMGDIKESDDNKVGLVGYHQGSRSIFLDAETGKALFGKQNAGKIILDPSQSINRLNKNNKIEKIDSALIYSGNYPINLFLSMNVPDVKELGNQHRDGDGMIIDLSTPQIGFGSGNFTVNQKGLITARGGGLIAGWKITDTRLYNNNTGMASSNLLTKDISANLPSSNASVAFHAGTNSAKNNFYVTHEGYLFSKSGNIAGWDINAKSLINGSVGMNSDPDNKTLPSITKHKAKAFFAGNTFYVTHDGYLRSTSGQIASWNIDNTSLSNGAVGMGEKTINKNRFSTKNPFNARFWAGAKAEEENFAVSTGGGLYSRSGKIGGWSIGLTSLSSGAIIISSEGQITATSGSNSWSISDNGSVKFNSGTIGAVKITSKGIEHASDSNNWHIWNDSVKFKNLRVSSAGDVYYKVSGQSGGGITSDGGGLGLTGKGGWVDPTKATTSSGGTKTLETAIKKLAVLTLSLNKFKLYSSLSVGDDGKVTKGDLIAYMGETNINFTKVPVAIAQLKVPYGGGGHYKEGVSGTLTFSNKATMTFAHGLLIKEPHIPKGEGKWD